MYLGSDSVLTPEISGGNQNQSTGFIRVPCRSAFDLLEARNSFYDHDDDDEPEIGVVGRPRLNRKGVQDEATLTEVDE
ncbi:MAG TPA: hypothetical protein VGD78_21000 [Chthoniobacterales bacterium]